MRVLVKQIFTYGFSSVLVRLLYFLLTPLYTYFFLPQEYASIIDLYAWMGFLTILLNFSLDTYFFRHQTPENQNRLFAQLFSLAFLIQAIFWVLILIFHRKILYALNYPYLSWIFWVAGILSLDQLSVLPLAMLRANGRSFYFATVHLAMVFLNLGLNLLYFFVLKNYFTWEPITFILIANFLASFFRLCFFGSFLKKITFIFSFSFLKDFLNYSFPLLLVGLLGVANEVLDRFLLKWLLYDADFPEKSLHGLGVYGAIYKFSILIALVNQAVRYAIEPWFLAQKNLTIRENFQKTILGFYLGILFLAALGILIFVPILRYFILPNPLYWEGFVILPILLLAQIFLAIYYQQSLWYKSAKKTIFGSLISAFGLLITLLINLIFIPHLGYPAAAWATFFCYLGMLGLSFVLEFRIAPIAYPWRKIFVLLFVTIFLMGFLQINIFDFRWNILRALGVLIFYCGVFVRLYKKEITSFFF